MSMGSRPRPLLWVIITLLRIERQGEIRGRGKGIEGLVLESAKAFQV